MTDEELTVIYRRSKTLAVVGASGTEGKPSHRIPRYLQSQGYRIIPVNPHRSELYGERAYASLREVDVGVDLVDVFRPPAEAEGIAADAVALGAGVLWFQPGTDTAEAVRIAQVGGLTVVTGECLGSTHARLGLGPGPSHD